MQLQQPKFNRRHIERILDIERRGTDDPWDMKRLRRALRPIGANGSVMEVGGVAVGYLVYRPTWEGAKRWVRLERIVIDPKYRRRGCGTVLIRRLILKASERGVEGIVAYVPERLLGVQLFLSSVGFWATGVRRAKVTGEDDEYRLEYPMWRERLNRRMRGTAG